MFKTKGFSANNSLQRRAVIVDAPDLPPEECEFFITSVGIADTDKVDVPDTKSPALDFEVEELYEKDEGSEEDGSNSNIPLINIKGVGKGTKENLEAQGINSVEELLSADPEELASKIVGISPKKVIEMQNSAKILIKT